MAVVGASAPGSRPSTRTPRATHRAANPACVAAGALASTPSVSAA